MKYKENYIITSHDVDINNNLKPSLIIRYMQETADHQMRDRRPSYYELFIEGKSFVLTRFALEIYDEIEKYDEIKAKTWRCAEKGATFVRCYSLERNGRIMANGYSEWAVTDRNEGKLCRASEVDISNYETDGLLEINLNKKFRVGRQINLKKVGEEHVAYTEVDMNKHMNNTYYPDMLWNYIPGILEKKVTSVNMHFRKEAPLWSNLEIFMAKGDGKVTGDKRSEESYLFQTKINGKLNVEAEFGVARL